MAIVTTEEFKTYTGIDHEDSDAAIAVLLESAEQALESRLRMKFITGSITQMVEQFPRYKRDIVLEFRPFQSLTSIKYYDTNDVEKTFDSDKVVVDSVSGTNTSRIQFPRLIIKQAYSWPDTRDIFAGKIVFTAGYGNAASDVPERFKEAVKRIARRWYDGFSEIPRAQLITTLPKYTAVDILADELRPVQGDIPRAPAHWDVSR